MQLSRLLGPVCLAVWCAVAALGAAQARSGSSALPPGRASAVPTALPSPAATPGCDKQMKIGEVTLCSDEFNFNFKSGDVQFPKPLHGGATDGTYRADRGYGNLHSQIMNLIGHVVVHRNATKDKAGKPVEAMTLTADQTHIESKAKYYRASGNVKIVQGDMTLTAPLVVDDEAHHTISASGGVKMVKGDKTLTAPQVVLVETTHVATLTGGVHAEQKPDRSFDASEVVYNTSTQDFKALGAVRLAFPASQPAPTPTPSGKPTSKPTSRPTPTATPAAASSPSIRPSPSASA